MNDFNLGWVLTVNHRGMEETPCKGYFSSSTLNPEEMLSIFRLLHPNVPMSKVELIDVTQYYFKSKCKQDVSEDENIMRYHCPHILENIQDGKPVDEEIAIFQSRGCIMHFVWKKWSKVKQFVTWLLEEQDK